MILKKICLINQGDLIKAENNFMIKFLLCTNRLGVLIQMLHFIGFLRMLDGGADPLYLARRIIRIAIEDIGFADPRAQTIALEAYQIYERLGFPEAELALSNAVIYLSMAPKSNSAYQAFNTAKSFIDRIKVILDVPIHLKKCPYQVNG